MKRYFPRAAALMVVALCTIQVPMGQASLGGAQIFTGEIMDKLCAVNGSHDQMIHDMKSMGREKDTCTLKCIQLGTQYTLFDDAKDGFYGIEEQEKVEQFAGHRVKISGTLHQNKISIEKIEAL